MEQLDKDLRLSADTFVKLINVFKNKGWEIPKDSFSMDSRFNRFCERLSVLNKSEQDLVIDLTKRFLVIDGGDYSELLIKLLDKINSLNLNILFSAKKIYILPLIAPEDKNKTKSSHCVWYHSKSNNIRYHKLLIDKDLVFCDFNHFSWLQAMKDDEVVILLDDYIGSGETAISAINMLYTSFNVNPEKILILSIAVQKTGLEFIAANTSATVEYVYLLSKGISDFYCDEELEIHKTNMHNIEKKLQVKKKYLFGYNQTEALISLIRTPNNTFPVFWLSDKKNKYAPFPRD